MREEIFAEEIFAEFIFAILPFFAKLNSEKNEENSFNRKNKFRKICKLQRAEKNKFLFSERLFFRNNYSMDLKKSKVNLYAYFLPRLGNNIFLCTVCNFSSLLCRRIWCSDFLLFELYYIQNIICFSFLLLRRMYISLKIWISEYNNKIYPVNFRVKVGFAKINSANFNNFV